MRVLVLGCGPAGLIAAHAAQMMYSDVVVFSLARQSRMFGAQYLHSPVPGITFPSDQFKIQYKLEGTPEGYQAKVYPDIRVKKVSPESLRGIHPAWDIRRAYDRLWGRWERKVQDIRITSPEDVDQLIGHLKPDLAISTLPAPMLCLEGHSFGVQKIWSSDSKDVAPPPENTVVCNGENHPAWYRAANIQGWITTEWPHQFKPPLPQHMLWEVDKPITTNCVCFPDVTRLGRYGKWQKGYLAHQAFNDTQALIKERA